MSDILIKNMEMPKACEGCPLCFLSSDGRNFFCTRQIGKRFDLSLSSQRQENCPLIPVPEHGDLVQLDDALDCFSEDDVVARKALRKIPVVLERTT